jgi:hypothetical protein
MQTKNLLQNTEWETYQQYFFHNGEVGKKWSSPKQTYADSLDALL